MSHGRLFSQHRRNSIANITRDTYIHIHLYNLHSVAIIYKIVLLNVVIFIIDLHTQTFNDEGSQFYVIVLRVDYSLRSFRKNSISRVFIKKHVYMRSDRLYNNYTK